MTAPLILIGVCLAGSIAVVIWALVESFRNCAVPAAAEPEPAWEIDFMELRSLCCGAAPRGRVACRLGVCDLCRELATFEWNLPHGERGRSPQPPQPRPIP